MIFILGWIAHLFRQHSDMRPLAPANQTEFVCTYCNDTVKKDSRTSIWQWVKGAAWILALFKKIGVGE